MKIEKSGAGDHPRALLTHPSAVVVLVDKQGRWITRTNLIISELPGRGEGPPVENFGGAQLPRYPLAPSLPPCPFHPSLMLARMMGFLEL